MRMRASPFFIADKNFSGTEKAQAVNLGLAEDGQSFSESWLQELIFRNPELLPVSTIEPVFERALSVCRELPTMAGPLDNLFITPDGNLILVECKLWKNPEARRQVIAQIMDYAKEMAGWSYDDLCRAVNIARNTRDENPLYRIVTESDYASMDEITFTDRVSRNLRLGRHLLLIVGDGIQEGVERLANYLQQNMGLHFTMGLVEIGLYNFPEKGGLIIVPSVVAKTVLIERNVVRIEQGEIRIEALDRKTPTISPRAESLSDVAFFEALMQADSQSAKWLRDFLKRAEEDLGIWWEVKQTLLPRYSPDGERVFGLGYFKTNGGFVTTNAAWNLAHFGLARLAHEYVDDIASLVPGSEIKILKDEAQSRKIMVKGRLMHIKDLIGQEDKFLAAIKKFVEAINDAVNAPEISGYNFTAYNR